jgi:oligopeptide transport system substrate-binding protein
MAPSMPIERFQKLKKEIRYEVQVAPHFYTSIFTRSIIHKRLFTDERVREALKLALDRDIITHKVKNYCDLSAIYGFNPSQQ